MLERKHAMVAREMEAEQQAMPDLDSALDDDIGDELLRLIFTACHPLLSREARAALALRMICGLTTEEIATRLSAAGRDDRPAHRARQADLSESGLAYETPRGEELSERLASVLEVVYLIFNEGYTAARGEDWLRPQLCNEALRMGRVLASIAPHEPEAHGLLALMELNASRTAARTDASGEPILMLDQNRALWDQLQIRRGMQALGRARELGGAGGFYALQAAIVACHAQARTAADTDWPRIAELYAELAAVVPRRSSNSTVRSRSAWPRGRKRRWRSSTRLAGEPALKGLSPAAERSRRPAPQARPLRGGARRVRSGRGAGRQQARTGPAAAARRRGGPSGVQAIGPGQRDPFLAWFGAPARRGGAHDHNRLTELFLSSTPDTFGVAPGLRVLVTAGASGIGLAISDLLIAHGAKVHICDVSDEFLADFAPPIRGPAPQRPMSHPTTTWPACSPMCAVAGRP